MQDLMNMTWKQVKEIDKEKGVVYVTIAPIEEHSLCLPLGTDVMEGEAWIKGAAEILEKSMELRCYKLPAFLVASASATGFYGCIHFSPKTTFRVIVELLENLVHMEFRNIVLVGSHGDPIHQIAIEKACKRINKKYGICSISPMGSFFSAEEKHINLNLPDEIIKMEKQFPNDFHAGWIETSCILDLNNELVENNYTELPDTEISEREMISSKKQLSSMGKYGHLGYPAHADKQLGQLLNKNTAEFLAKVTEQFVKRNAYEQYMFHSLYAIPFMHIQFLKYRKWEI